TRDRYRHAVEALARRHHLSELDVALAAVACCREAQAGPDGRGQHVGYYLIDRGQRELERRLGVRPPLGLRWSRLLARAPLPIYLGALALLTAAFTRPLLVVAAHAGLAGWALWLLGVATVLLASQLSLSLLNWFVTLAVAPRSLPRMDYSGGIPDTARTLVAVPSLCSSAAELEELVEALEVRFLGNRDSNLKFALLTDFGDADAPELPGDEALLRLARLRIEGLNQRYASADSDRFFMLHRPRQWNATERCWMGHERKRGKLNDLNALLRGHGRERFMFVAGDLDALQSIRYVITLDTDTQLPRDSAHELVGTLDHPLNRAVYDPAQQRVVAGYGILQPRVGLSLPSSARSRYAQFFGSDAGIDPYTRMVSDVYQDLFGEGSFIGKGIYDVDAFELALAGRFPDNRILSHDLVEGCHARSGLLSDVQVYEEHPAHYGVDVKRRHRWIRGDWQLLPWLLPWAPTAQRGWRPNATTALSRWKILDNLRRSLVPTATLALLLFGWVYIDRAASWTLAVLAMILLPPLLAALLDLVQKPREVAFPDHLRANLRTTGQHLLRMGLSLSWLPHEVHYSLDAIVRTLWRMAVSHRHLLQWQTSAEVMRSTSDGLLALWRAMWIGPLLALVLLLALGTWRP